MGSSSVGESREGGPAISAGPLSGDADRLVSRSVYPWHRSFVMQIGCHGHHYYIVSLLSLVVVVVVVVVVLLLVYHHYHYYDYS